MKLSVLALVFWLGKFSCERKSPHLILIVADDLGWNDVSFHGSDEIPTPHIDSLAYNGVIIKNHYSETLCTPSRAALLTGKYPIHTGMQHNVLMETHAAGLPLSERLFPEYLRSLEYKTHAIGKWHLGFYKKEYTPTYRGFDSFYGFWNGYQDYYKHNVQAWFVPYDGYDMRRNMDVDWEAVGQYSTDLFTNEAVQRIRSHNQSVPLFLYIAQLAPHAGTFEDPLQAPESEQKKFLYLKDPKRRRYAAMVSKLDSSVGRIVKALKENSMLEDSIIVFISDNGAPTVGLMKNHGSNWPLKGEKSTPWEGGIRTVGLVWSAHLKKSQRVSTQLMHITDWLPTLYAAAGGNEKDLADIDGTNLWHILSGRDDEIVNYTMLHNIDEERDIGYAAVREGPYKLVYGTSMLGYLDFWSGEPQSADVPSYNVDRVKGSTTNVLLSMYGRGEKLTDAKIVALRNASKIICTSDEATNLGSEHAACRPREKPCLFNIFQDPCELRNLYELSQLSEIRTNLENKINKFRRQRAPVQATHADKRSDPALYNGTWTNWADFWQYDRRSVDGTERNAFTSFFQKSHTEKKVWQ